MKLIDFLKEEAIQLNLQSQEKDSVLKELVELLCEVYQLKNLDEILEAVLQREKLSSTGLRQGLAIPHAKISGVSKVFLLLGLSRKGIDFQSMDQEPSRIFFLLISPKTAYEKHVQTLACITRLMKEESLRKALLNCSKSAEVFQLIQSIEEKQ